MDNAPPSGPELDLTEAEAGATPGETVVPDGEVADTGLPALAKSQADGSVVLGLRFPVTLKLRVAGVSQERTFTELHLRRLKGADKKKAQTRAAEDMIIFLAAASTGENTVVMNALYDNMDAEDASALEQVIGVFFGLGRKTGR